MPHTPGPWHNDGYRIYAPTDSENKRDGRMIVEYKHVDDFNDADAPLIAASPEMYALLKELELSNHVVHGFYRCPSCGGEVQDKNATRGVCVSAMGHEKDCKLAAVLKAVEGEPNA